MNAVGKVWPAVEPGIARLPPSEETLFFADHNSDSSMTNLCLGSVAGNENGRCQTVTRLI